MESGRYNEATCRLYELVNGKQIPMSENAFSENPYTSFSYFRYNVDQFIENGYGLPSDEARISKDESEEAEYPDGVIRYKAEIENESEKRLEIVLSTSSGACNYLDTDLMTELDPEKVEAFENLNPAYTLAEDYINSFASAESIEVRGSLDARDWGLDDKRFIDYIHLDRKGTDIVWNKSK